jgi:DNA-binding NtrC family response regulator
MTMTINEQIKILVVDDDWFMRDLLNRFLGKKAYEVALADSGEAAIQLASEKEFQIGLIDILLTGMDGLELADRLKQLQPDMMIILMTGHPTIETALEALKQGVQEYLIKPFKLDQLEIVVQKCIHIQEIISENKALKEALYQANQRVEKYELIIRQPHMAHVPGLEKLPNVYNGDKIYRKQSLKSKEESARDHLNKLDILKEEGMISDIEYEKKRKLLLAGTHIDNHEEE